MTRSQVRYLLGTPMVPDAFDKDRWDYLYLPSSKGHVSKPEQRHLIVYLQGRQGAQIDKANASADTCRCRRKRHRQTADVKRPPSGDADRASLAPQRSERPGHSRPFLRAPAAAPPAHAPAPASDRAAAAGRARCGRRPRAHRCARTARRRCRPRPCSHGTVPAARWLHARPPAHPRRSPRRRARPSTGTAARAWRRPPRSACGRGHRSRAARVPAPRRHRRARPRSARTAARTAAPDMRLAKAKRMVELDAAAVGADRRQPPLARPGSRNGPLTSCMCTRVSGSRSLRVVNSACSGPLAHADAWRRSRLGCATRARARACTTAGTAGSSRYR